MGGTTGVKCIQDISRHLTHPQLFWGWDLIAPGGLLDHVYAHMGLSEGVCLGLKRLVKQCTPHTDGEGGVQRPFVSYELITAFASMLGADQLYVSQTLRREDSTRAAQVWARWN